MTTILKIYNGVSTLSIRNKQEEIVNAIIIDDLDKNIKKKAILNKRHSEYITARLSNSSLKNPKREIVAKFAERIFS